MPDVRLSRVLVANRGEIALRIIRACQEEGLEAVAVYSDADRLAPHVRAADSAVALGAPPAAESYLNVAKLIAAARASGCQAVHPGYGFLSERAPFADACVNAGLVFVGPPAAAMRAMGDKTEARRRMQAAGVPIVPGMLTPLHDAIEARREAKRMGYPLLLKAAAGGGGKGMRVVRAEAEIESAFQGARSEAQKAFGDGALYLEKYLERPRHIEIQVLADKHGRVVALGERECSIQRRHQKLIEEAPSPVVSPALRRRLSEAATAAAGAVGYVGAGTIEFLLAQTGEFYFLEMNTRIQVEHPVTELVYGVDLVREQLHVAAGGPIRVHGGVLQPRGHAIECRITAEDPFNGFLPATGVLQFLRVPAGPGVRWDGGVEAGNEVTLYYDPLLAKLEYPPPGEEDQELARRLYTAPEAAARLALVSDLVEAHDSTLIFVNSRVNAEMLGSKFNMMDQKIMVHHGSLPKEERVRAEEAFKARQIKGLVCTSTLELGIDIGSVDLVVQYMSPRQVNSLVQRVGRSGHSLTRTSQGVLVSVSTEDLLESIGVIELAKEGRLEPTIIHHGALDVLAHQVAGLLMDSEGSVPFAHIKQVLSRAFPYSKLEDAELEKVVEFMRKMGYLKRDDQDLYRTSRTRLYYYENLSMIPDERRYPVIDLTNLQSVGILGEEFMLTMAHVGLNFIVKGRVWQMKQITDDGKVYVLPVNDPTAAIPGWDGQILPVPGALAVRVGEYRKQIDRLLDEHKTRAPVVEQFSRIWPADPYGVRRAVEEIETHRATGAPVPTNDRVLIEGFDRYIIIHTHFGDVLNFTLGEVIEELFRRQGLVRMWWWDSYRILYEMTADTADLDLEDLFLKQVFGVDEPVLGGACHGVLHRHFPWELQMKQIAERFGALSRGRLMYGGAMKELQIRFRLTPIYDETIRLVAKVIPDS